jgi:Tfp pilus assembly protein PilF
MTDRIHKLRKFLEDSPEDSFLQHALALEYVKLGDEPGARALFETILQREPQYIGSYYHLGKLLERTGETDAAVKVYEAGMTACKQAGETHAYNELQAAYEDLVY